MRVTALFLLQNFYKSEINKEEMYIRYIHKLCDMHLQAENYTGESGTTQGLFEVLLKGFDSCHLILYYLLNLFGKNVVLISYLER